MSPLDSRRHLALLINIGVDFVNEPKLMLHKLNRHVICCRPHPKGMPSMSRSVSRFEGDVASLRLNQGQATSRNSPAACQKRKACPLATSCSACVATTDAK